MTDAKKKRLSMLDSLASASKGAIAGTEAGSEVSSPALTGSMMSTNRALRSARDAVDGFHVWDLDPGHIDDDRLQDRLDPEDVLDLRDAIDAFGQTVPILVRRHPSKPDRYLLVYGRRRLEAVRLSKKVHKIRALVASIDETEALKAQISENLARRDLSFIERALLARELIDRGYGNQSQVAEMLNVSKSAVSMALAVIERVGLDLIRVIGAAPGVGRPKWERLAEQIEERNPVREELMYIADKVRRSGPNYSIYPQTNEKPLQEVQSASCPIFDAVMVAAEGNGPASPKPATSRDRVSRTSSASRPMTVEGRKVGSLRLTSKGVSLTLNEGPFAHWVANEAQELIQELHARWEQQRGED